MNYLNAKKGGGLPVLRKFVITAAILCMWMMGFAIASAAEPAIDSITYTPSKPNLTICQWYDLVDGYWDMWQSDLHPEPIQQVQDYLVEDYSENTKLLESKGIHSGDKMTVRYANGTSEIFTSKTYYYWAGGSLEYEYCIAWYDAAGKLQDIDVSYKYSNYVKRNKDGLLIPGKYTPKVSVSFADQRAEYTMKIVVTKKTAKKANTLTVKTKNPVVKYSKLKKKAQTISVKKAFAVSKAQGKVKFKKVRGNKKILINSAGKITVKKGLKKGSYKIKIKVSAVGNKIYKSKTKTVTLTIRIK